MEVLCLPAGGEAGKDSHPSIGQNKERDSIPRVLVDPSGVGLIDFVLGTCRVHFHLAGAASVAGTHKKLSSFFFLAPNFWKFTFKTFNFPS